MSKKNNTTKADKLLKAARRYNPERPDFLEGVNVQKFARTLKDDVITVFQSELDMTEAALETKAANEAEKTIGFERRYLDTFTLTAEAFAYIPEELVSVSEVKDNESNDTVFYFNSGKFEAAIDRAIEAAGHDRTSDNNRAYYELESLRDVTEETIAKQCAPYEQKKRAATASKQDAIKNIKKKASVFTLESIVAAYDGELPEGFKSALISGANSVKLVNTVERVINGARENVRSNNALTATRIAAATLTTAYTWCNLIKTERDFTIGVRTQAEADTRIEKNMEDIRALESKLSDETAKVLEARSLLENCRLHIAAEA